MLESVFSACESCEPHRDPSLLWSGAVFFAHTDCNSDEEYSTMFSRCLDKYLQNHRDERGHLYLPDCIAILDGPVITFEKLRQTGAETQVKRVRMFDCQKLSVAVLLSHFYDSLSERGRTLRKRGEWTQMLQQNSYKVFLNRDLEAE